MLRDQGGPEYQGREKLRVREVSRGGWMRQGVRIGPEPASHSLNCTDTEESVTLVLRSPPGSSRFFALCRKLSLIHI